MNNKRKNILLFGALTAVILLSLYLYKENKQLKSVLEEEKKKGLMYKETQEYYDQIAHIDSLLYEKKYKEGLKAYESSLSTIDSSFHPMIMTRINLIEQLIASLDKPDTVDKLAVEALDSTELTQAATVKEINKYDSLAFALQKANVQIEYLKHQLRQRESGEYLTFSSERNNKVYYVGQVKNGKANGTGVALWNTGSRYEGTWKDNKRHGKGVFYWLDGERYEGEYDAGKRHGYGSYYWPNGEKYVGGWVNDQRSGEGTFYGEDGEIIASGIWENDELTKVEKK